MNRLLYILLLSTTPAFSFIFKVEEIKEVNSKTSGEFAFPVLTGSQNLIAKRINDVLQLVVLRQQINKHKSSIFERIWPTEDVYGLQSMGYVVFNNDGYIFSIGFYYETMSSYPDNSEQYFTFNAQNGDLLELDDFFYADAFAAFDKLVRKKHKDVLFENVRNMVTSLKEDPDSEQYKDELEQIDGLLDCLIRQQIEKFYIDARGININFYDGFCFPKVWRAFDIDWHVAIPFSEITRLLDGFGTNILSNKDKPVHEFFPGKDRLMVLRGSIDGKFPFVLYYNSRYWNIYDTKATGSGCYWYSRVGEALSLSGSTSDKMSYEIFESDAKNKKTGLFKIDFLEDKPAGTWTDLKTKRELNIVFDAQSRSVE